MAGTNAQTLALQLEKVRDKVALAFEQDSMLHGLIQERGDAEIVSSRNMRLPLALTPGGKAGAYSPDGGDLGRGSMTAYDFAQISPQYFRIAVEINTQVKYATDSREKAIENAIKRELSSSLAQFKLFMDTILQGSGNGVIGTVSSVSANVLTMSVPSGAALVYDGQVVGVYDTTLATYRGSATVVAHDPVSSTQTITLDAAPGGTTGTDVLVYDGLGGVASPVGIFGLKYHQNNAKTGTWMGLNKATYATQLSTPSVNASNSALVPSHIRLAFNLIRKALGINAELGKTRKPNLIGYGAVEQEHAYENLGINSSQVIKEGAGGRADSYDGLFTGNLTMSGVPFKPSIHADQTRIDFLDLSHWGRAVSKEIGLFEDGEGKTVFPVYGASGGIAAANLFYYDLGENIWLDNPRMGSYIYSLGRPSGY